MYVVVIAIMIVRLSPHMTKRKVPGSSYGLSASGWIDRKLFCDSLFIAFIHHL